MEREEDEVAASDDEEIGAKDNFSIGTNEHSSYFSQNLRSVDDLEILRSYQFSTELIKKKLSRSQFGSFLFTFLSDSIKNQPLPVFLYAGTFMSFVYTFFLYIGCLSISYLGSTFDPRMNKFLDDIGFLFMYTSTDTNKHYLLTFPPFYMQIIIFFICIVCYISFFIYKKKRFYGTFFPSFFMYVCMTLSTPLISYEVVAIASSLTMLCLSNDPIYLVVPIIGFCCMPCLIISLLRAMIAVAVEENPTTNNNAPLSLIWYLISFFSFGLNAIGHLIYKYYMSLLFLFTLILVPQIVILYFLLTRMMFVDPTSKVLSFLLPFFSAYSAILGIFQTIVKISTTPETFFLNTTNFAIIVGVGHFSIVVFSVYFTGYKRKKYQKIAENLDSEEIKRMTNDQIIEMFTFCNATTTNESESNREVIKKIIETSESIDLSLFALRFLLNSKCECHFIYEKAVNILLRQSSSFIVGIQTTSIIELSLNFIDIDMPTVTSKQKLMNHVLSTCYAAQTFFWQAVLHSSSTQILKYADILCREIENAQNYFYQFGINNEGSNQYGIQYLNFVKNITGDLEEADKIVKNRNNTIILSGISINNDVNNNIDNKNDNADLNINDANSNQEINRFNNEVYKDINNDNDNHDDNNNVLANKDDSLLISGDVDSNVEEEEESIKDHVSENDNDAEDKDLRDIHELQIEINNNSNNYTYQRSNSGKKNFQNNYNLAPTESLNTISVINRSYSAENKDITIIQDHISILQYNRSAMQINPLNRERVKLCKVINKYKLPNEGIHAASIIFLFSFSLFIVICALVMTFYIFWSSVIAVEKTDHFIDVLAKVYKVAYKSLSYAVSPSAETDLNFDEEIMKLIEAIPNIIKNIEETTPKNEIYDMNIATSTLLAIQNFLSQYFGNCTRRSNLFNPSINDKYIRSPSLPLLMNSSSPLSPLYYFPYNTFNSFSNESNHLSYNQQAENTQNEEKNIQNESKFESIESQTATFSSISSFKYTRNEIHQNNHNEINRKDSNDNDNNNNDSVNNSSTSKTDCGFIKISLMNITVSLVNFCNKMIDIQYQYKTISEDHCKLFKKVVYIYNYLILTIFIVSLAVFFYLIAILSQDLINISKQPLLLKKKDVSELFHSFKTTIDDEMMRRFKEIIKFQTKYSYQIKFTLILLFVYVFHFIFINIVKVIFLKHQMRISSAYNLIVTLPVLQTSYYTVACTISDSPSFNEFSLLLKTTISTILDFDNENFTPIPKNAGSDSTNSLRIISKGINPIQTMAMFPLPNKSHSAKLMSRMRISSFTLYEIYSMMEKSNLIEEQYTSFLRTITDDRSEQSMLVESLKDVYKNKFGVSIFSFFILSILYTFIEILLFYLSLNALKGVKSIITIICRICTLFPENSCFASALKFEKGKINYNSNSDFELEMNYLEEDTTDVISSNDSNKDSSNKNSYSNENIEINIDGNSICNNIDSESISYDNDGSVYSNFNFTKPLPNCILENIVNSLPVSIVCTNHKGYIKNSNSEFDDLCSQNSHIVLSKANHHGSEVDRNTSESYDDMSFGRTCQNIRSVLRIKDFKEVVVDPDTNTRRYFLITEFGGKSLPCDEFGRKLNWSGSKCYIINDNTRLQNKKERVRLMSKNVETLRNYILPPSARELKKERLVMISQLAIIEIVIRNNSNPKASVEPGKSIIVKQPSKPSCLTGSPKTSTGSCLNTLLNPNLTISKENKSDECSPKDANNTKPIEHNRMKSHIVINHINNSSSNTEMEYNVPICSRRNTVKRKVGQSPEPVCSTFEDDEFLEFKRELMKISERFSMILTLNITRSQVSVVFRGCSTNRNRQYVREGFSFIQKVIELLHGRQSKIAFVTGSCCICNVEDLGNENFSLFSRSFVKAMGMLRCCDWGEVVTEWGVMKMLINVFKNVSRQGTVSLNGFDDCDYSIIQQSSIAL